MKVKFTTEINCSAEHLWSFFAVPEKLPLWVAGLQEFTITSPPPHGAGSTYVMKIKEGKHLYEYEGRNLVWDPPLRIKEKIWGGRLKAGQLMTIEYRIIDLRDCTRLEYENDLQASFGMKLVFIIAGRAYCKSMINSLKRRAEEAGERTKGMAAT